MNQTQAIERVKKCKAESDIVVAEFPTLKCEVCGRIPKFCYEYWQGNITITACPTCYGKLLQIEKLMEPAVEIF